jgi:pimeloyl-ACP methyl ester carboxylesterase
VTTLNKLPALALAASLAATGLVAASPSGVAAVKPAPPAASGVSSISWHRCSESSLRAFGARCGFVKVPRDYAHPHGKMIKIAVSRVRHTVSTSKYQGVMLVNPGGPGGSGLGLSVLGPIISTDFRRKDAGGAYDWIGFDPRGVGASVPSVSCNPNYLGPDRPDYVPTTPALLHVWKARARGYANDCAKNALALLKHAKTTDTVRDMDRIRAALGKSQINYYGFSYGTYLAQVYTKLFPSRMRRMVLDSNVDPRQVWYQANLSQDVAFERNLGIFLSWIARHNFAYHLGATPAEVRHRYVAVHDALAAHPINGVVGPDEWDDIFLAAGYAQSLWPDLAQVFAGWANDQAGDPAVQAFDNADTPGDDNGYAAYLATSCTDARWKGNDWLADNWRVFYQAPLNTWTNAWFNQPCFYWPAKAGVPTKITGAGVGAALLVDETLDAATPYEGSLYLRRIFRSSRLVATVGGTSHAVSPSGNACVDNKIFDYLADGTLPRRKAGGGADVKCDAPAKPSPAPTAESFGVATSTQSLALAARAGDAMAGRLLVGRLVLAANRFSR